MTGQKINLLTQKRRRVYYDDAELRRPFGAAFFIGEREEGELMTTILITREELRRINEKVAPLVLQFTREHATFYSRDLDAWVEARLGYSANETATRCLRSLRQKRYLDYYVDGDHLFHMTQTPQPDLQLEFGWDDDGINDE
jgi:hypothetical protein